MHDSTLRITIGFVAVSLAWSMILGCDSHEQGGADAKAQTELARVQLDLARTQTELERLKSQREIERLKSQAELEKLRSELNNLTSATSSARDQANRLNEHLSQARQRDRVIVMVRHSVTQEPVRGADVDLTFQSYAKLQYTSPPYADVTGGSYFGNASDEIKRKLTTDEFGCAHCDEMPEPVSMERYAGNLSPIPEGRRLIRRVKLLAGVTPGQGFSYSNQEKIYHFDVPTNEARLPDSNQVYELPVTFQLSVSRDN